MARLRYNGLSTTLGGSLTSSATSVTFGAALTYGGGTNVPTISGSDYIPLSILGSTGRLSEVVYLTAYTSGATTGTITRGQEGTTGVAHSSGDKVTHGPLVADVTPAFVGSRVHATASQSITNATWSTVAFTTEDIDTNGFHDTVTNNQRMTIPAGMGGKYWVKACVSFASSGSGTRHVSFMLNGTTRLAAATLVNATASFRSRVQTDDIMTLAAGDFVHVEAYQDSGSASQIGDTTTGGSVGETFFIVQYLGT